MEKTDNRPFLELVRDSGWLTIWFNRPHTRNCLSEARMLELIALMAEVREDTDLRGVIFRGKGGIFCAGGDLKELQKFGEFDGQQKAKQAADANGKIARDFFKSIRELPQITVTVVEGPAMAGGFGIACASDFLVTMSDAKFSLTETRIGLTAAQIVPYVVERLGFAQARRLTLLASTITGDQAYEMGMADFIADNRNDLESILKHICGEVQACSPTAIAATKTIFGAIHTMDKAERTELAAELFSQSLISDDGKEGFDAFMEKRKPKWNDPIYRP